MEKKEIKQKTLVSGLEGCSRRCVPRINGSPKFHPLYWVRRIFPMCVLPSPTSHPIKNSRLNCCDEKDGPAWCEADLDVMEARVKAARSLSASTTNNIQPRRAEAPLSEERGLGLLDGSKNLPDGWRLLSERGWQPCPIGVYVGAE